MDILGYVIFGKKKTLLEDVEKIRDNSPFGPVLFNIQVRLHGVSVSGPNGIEDFRTLDQPADIRAIMFGLVMQETLCQDYPKYARTFSDAETNRWIDLGNKYVRDGVVDPYRTAYTEILYARNQTPDPDRDRDVR